MDDDVRNGAMANGGIEPCPGEASEHRPAGSPLRSICVFCGSSEGASPAYRAAAAALGRLLAARGIRLVYGGGRVGLMGVLASAAAAAGGEVIGVIPRALLVREAGFDEPDSSPESVGESDLRIVDSMHERKALMAELADGFIALPGGYGTLEELCEMITWAQLGIHEKPCGLLDVEGYFSPLIAQFDLAVDAGFVRPEHRRLILTERDPQALLGLMEGYVAPPTMRWIDARES